MLFLKKLSSTHTNWEVRASQNSSFQVLEKSAKSNRGPDLQNILSGWRGLGKMAWWAKSVSLTVSFIPPSKNKYLRLWASWEWAGIITYASAHSQCLEYFWVTKDLLLIKWLQERRNRGCYKPCFENVNLFQCECCVCLCAILFHRKH